VHFFFQPAEEGGGGGRVMVEEGLFDKFPCESVFGMHNRPSLSVGQFAVRSGPMMAAAGRFDIRITGKGTHGARPETGIDSVLVGGHIITALQSIVSRNISPHSPIVISVTQMHAGDAYNVIPESAVLRGTFRAFTPELIKTIMASMERVAKGVAAGFGAKVECEFHPGYPPLVNNHDEAMFAADIAESIVGKGNVNRNGPLVMGSEDFSYMLNACPGAFVLIGNGGAEEGSPSQCEVHNPKYDFNDEILPLGAQFFARLVETKLAPKS
jgi:amidohydrolase